MADHASAVVRYVTVATSPIARTLFFVAVAIFAVLLVFALPAGQAIV